VWIFSPRQKMLRAGPACWRQNLARLRGVVLLLVLPTSAALFGEDQHPFAGDAKATKAGEFQFRINCAFCHGLGTRGGGRGPDLTRAQKRHGSLDADLFRTTSQGVSGTPCPPNGTTGQGAGMTDEESGRSLLTCGVSRLKRQPSQLETPPMGKNFSMATPTVRMSHGGRERRVPRA
jgi:hypothetical protein